MDFLPGFAWPVPRAFASAVGVCRFEQGDVLFDAPVAYGPWQAGGPQGVGCWVQVLDPPRSARAAPADAEGNRFATNWKSPVTLEMGEIAKLGAAQAQTVQCTQGQLFSCLWRGDRGVLEDAKAGAAADPRLPAFARDLQKQLDSAVPALRAAFRGAADVGVQPLFVIAVDESNEASLAKAREIGAALAARWPAVSVELSPASAGVANAGDFHPTLRIKAWAVSEKDPEALREVLKRALYVPGRATRSAAAAPETDRFKLERHGLLVLPAAASSGS